MEELFDVLRRHLGQIIFLGAVLVPSLLSALAKKKGPAPRRGQAPPPRSQFPDPMDEPQPSSPPKSARDWLEELLGPEKEATPANLSTRPATSAPPASNAPMASRPRPAVLAAARRDTIAPPLQLQRSERSTKSQKRRLEPLKSAKPEATVLQSSRRLSRARKLVGGSLSRDSMLRTVLLREILDRPLGLRDSRRAAWDG